jgi:class 3 adenylate cyclase
MSDPKTDPTVNPERHLAAILATDVVSYSHLMEQDEVGTLRRLRDLRHNLIEPKVSEHRGRVFKTMGDGFLAEFGSALDAVQCAVDIQGMMNARNLDLPESNRLQLRIGINLGDVFHEGDDVFGDGVNIAARLESIAPAGGIYVSRAACDPIRERLAFDFQDLGNHHVKNIERPIQVFGVRIEGLAESKLFEQPGSVATPAPSQAYPPETRRAVGRRRAVKLAIGIAAAIVMVAGVSALVYFGVLAAVFLTRSGPAPLPSPASQSVSYEPGIDRPGGDYRSFDLSAPDASQCSAACLADAQCRAFTYVNPGVQAATARCWLKSIVPNPGANSCCISGVRRAEVPPRPPTGGGPQTSPPLRLH